MARAGSSLVIGVGGHVVKIDPATGSEIWRTKVKGTSFVTISQAAGRVFAGANGELFCLDEASGRVLWHNKLKGLGLGVVAFPGSSELVAAAAEAAARAAAAGAS
jgi:outer membrane protein assembly factor BamB